MDRIKFLFSGIYQFLKPFILILMTHGGMLLMQAASEAVTACATNMASSPGAEKRAVAYDMIVDRLRLDGITLASFVVNAAIEAAVIKLQSVE